jgi:hypothetical protein
MLTNAEDDPYLDQELPVMAAFSFVSICLSGLLIEMLVA